MALRKERRAALTLRVFNTLTGTKEDFVPLRDDRVTMYVCGPTVYDHPHIGNWRCFVVFDTVRKYLKYKGFDVLYVQNFTDVDDKVIRKSLETGKSPKEVARKYMEMYLAEASILDIERADIHPRATLHIDDMIVLTETLVKTGHAYEAGGNVYFNTTSFDGYGKLSKQKVEDLQTGARIELDENKRNPLDFVLWKAQKPQEPAWDSPWGPGRPGWHLECSAMAVKYLGETLDIHAGGSDLVFPHHENEIAQSESASGKQFARYWLHNAFLNIGGERMGKSLGNFYTLDQLLGKYQPEAIRFFLLSAHYRKPLDFTEKALAASARGLSRLRSVTGHLLKAWKTVLGNGDLSGTKNNASKTEQEWFDAVNRSREKFEYYMDDDFNTADAFAVLFDLARDINKGFPLDPSPDLLLSAIRFYYDAGNVLGVLRDYRRAASYLLQGTGYVPSGVISFAGIAPAPFRVPAVEASAVEGSIDAGVSSLAGSGSIYKDYDKLIGGIISIIVDIRNEARENKDYEAADRIRDRLAGLNVVLEDAPEGTRWKMGGGHTI